jgi:hypothetical protein
MRRRARPRRRRSDARAQQRVHDPASHRDQVAGSDVGAIRSPVALPDFVRG